MSVSSPLVLRVSVTAAASVPARVLPADRCTEETTVTANLVLVEVSSMFIPMTVAPPVPVVVEVFLATASS